MEKWFKVFPLSVLLASVSGCAGTPKQSVAPVLAAEQAEAKEPVVVPSAAPMSSELLYRIMMGELAGQRRLYDVSLQQYLQAARDSRDPQIAERAVRIALFAGDEQAAVEGLDIWIASNPGDIEARQIAAILHLRDGRPTEAVQQLQKVVSFSKSPELGFHRVVGLLGKEKDKAVALGVLTTLVQKYPKETEAWYVLSLMGLHAGELSQAEEAIEKALALKPDWPKAHVTHARILIKQGKQEEGLAVMGEMVEANPEDYANRLIYGRMLVEARRPEQAREQFRILFSQDPKDADVLYALALLSLQTSDMAQAREVLLRLVKFDKYEGEAHYYLGQIAEEEDELEEAQHWYSGVKEGDFQLPARIRGIILQAKRGEVEEALEQLQRLRLQNPKLVAQLYLIEGEILRDAEHLEEAMALYDRALEEVAGDNDLLYARGLLAERMDRMDILERDLRAILAADPDNVDALNALGYTLADRTTRYNEAFRFIKRALELKPDNAAIIDSMGWLQYRLGNYKEAARYLRKALAHFEDAEIAAHLGEVLWAMGDIEEARKVVTQALQTDPDSPLLLKIWKRLK